MLTLRWARAAAEFYDGLTGAELRRVDEVLSQIASEPYNSPNTKTLTGPLTGLLSRRIGSWRIIYDPKPAEGLVDILVFADRRDTYG